MDIPFTMTIHGARFTAFTCSLCGTLFPTPPGKTGEKAIANFIHHAMNHATIAQVKADPIDPLWDERWELADEIPLVNPEGN